MNKGLGMPLVFALLLLTILSVLGHARIQQRQRAAIVQMGSIYTLQNSALLQSEVVSVMIATQGIMLKSQRAFADHIAPEGGKK